MTRRAASNTSAISSTPTTQSACVSSPARSVRSASKTHWYSPVAKPARPSSQPSARQTPERPSMGGNSAKIISSTKPTWMERITWLESG